MEEKNLIQEGWRNLKHGVTDLALGFFFVFCATSRKIAHSVNNAVHAYPWCFIIVETLIFASVAFFYIGTARSERDMSRQKAWRTETAKDSLQIIVDSYIPRYGKQ